MPNPLTHRERAERALKALYKTGWVPREAFLVPGPASDIARETFPRELVKAARFVIHKCALYGPADQAREKIRTALALYEKEPDHEA